MKKVLNKIKWYQLLVILFIIGVILVFVINGENSVLAIHDNLDLFIPQYQMMKTTGSFFATGATVPFLHNISRDYLPASLNLYTLLFVIMPCYPAYVIGYVLKIIIAIVGAILLAKEILRDSYKVYEPLVYLIGLAYGVLNLFPNFGIAFASIPILLMIMHRIISAEHISVWYYVALFLYPFISYFSYLGIFFIGYMCVYFIYKWIKERRFPVRVLIAIPVLSLGYVFFEHRLFYTMLFSDVESIRSTMVKESLDWPGILAMMWEGFTKGDMHTLSDQRYLVLPVCIIYFIYQTISYIRAGEPKKILKDYFNWVMAFIIFNSVIYGLFYWEPLRDLFELIVPPLKGFEFQRTEFSNPFLWYVAFFIVLKRIYDKWPGRRWIANGLALLAVGIIVLDGAEYNDLYHTCFETAYRTVYGHSTDNLSYREFYSEELFDMAKDDIDYQGEEAVAYGFYPAILEYNGISTLDGYLGYYSLEYKEDFRKIIAPALERVEESRAYFDNWGARCYTYSGSYTTNISAYRNYDIEEETLYMDIDALKALDGKYIFSRMSLSNAADIGLELCGSYSCETSPYELYVYMVK